MDQDSSKQKSKNPFSPAFGFRRVPLSLSEVFQRLKVANGERVLNLGEIFSLLGVHSHGILIALLSLPFLLPVPLPGLSVALGLAIALIAFFWVLGRPPWLPQKMAGLVISASTLDQVLNFGLKVSGWMEWVVRPRLSFLFRFRLFRWVLGLALMSAALFLALPLPPGTNLPPAITLFVMALGLIEDDGVVALLGLMIYAVNVYLLVEISQFLIDFLLQTVRLT